MITSMKKPSTKLYDLSGRQPVEAKSRTFYTSTVSQYGGDIVAVMNLDSHLVRLRLLATDLILVR
jgi:hypothetical protein